MNDSVKIEFHRRAKVQLRSLSDAEQKNIDSCVQELLTSVVMLKKFKTKDNDELYVLETDSKFLLLLTYTSNLWTVQDIVHKKMLKEISKYRLPEEDDKNPSQNSNKSTENKNDWLESGPVGREMW